LPRPLVLRRRHSPLFWCPAPNAKNCPLGLGYASRPALSSGSRHHVPRLLRVAHCRDSTTTRVRRGRADLDPPKKRLDSRPVLEFFAWGRDDPFSWSLERPQGCPSRG